MAAVIEEILTNRGDMKRSLVIAVERQEQSAKTGMNREAIQWSIFIYPKSYTAVKTPRRPCLSPKKKATTRVAFKTSIQSKISSGACR
ncbi:hypothetical protein [Limnohabitans sp. Rim47]|uniref:hypothetical protein n=1 Tax=Limnohabitans sp. Rim47 TaxID=1100721 RepID=UPI0012DC5367|nr:hypothetical protein [Limnohabitans sp. Rim47]